MVPRPFDPAVWTVVRGAVPRGYVLRVVCVCVGLSVRHQHAMHGMVLVMFSISWIPKFARAYSPSCHHGPIRITVGVARLGCRRKRPDGRIAVNFGESAFVRHSVRYASTIRNRITLHGWSQRPLRGHRRPRAVGVNCYTALYGNWKVLAAAR